MYSIRCTRCGTDDSWRMSFGMKKREEGVTEEMMSGLTVVKKRLLGLPPR